MTVLAKFKLNDKEMIVARSYEMDYRVSDLGDYGNDLAVFAVNDKKVVKSWFKALGLNIVSVSLIIALFPLLTIFINEITKQTIFINQVITASLLVFMIVFVVIVFNSFAENSLWSIIKIPFNLFKVLINKNALYSYTAHNYGNFHSDQSWMLLDMEEVSRKYLFHKPETINDIEKYVNALTDDEIQQFFVDGLIAGQINSRIHNLEQTLNNSGYGMNALKNDVNKEIAKLQKEQQKYENKRKHHTVKLINAEVNESLVNELSKNSQFAA